jgi:hypothetical protein
MNQLIAVLEASAPAFTPEQRATWVEIRQQGMVMSSNLKAFGLEFGAGLYPNTFVKAGVYAVANNAIEEATLLLAGWIVATYPETMSKFGAPDIVVHNAVEKDRALDLGYTLAGLPASVVLGDA